MRKLFFAAATAHAFVHPPAPRTTRLQMMPPKPGDMTPESMRQAADALKTLKPDQIQQMLKEVEDMSPEERERLKGERPCINQPVSTRAASLRFPRRHGYQPRHAQDVHEGNELCGNGNFTAHS